MKSGQKSQILTNEEHHQLRQKYDMVKTKNISSGVYKFKDIEKFSKLQSHQFINTFGGYYIIKVVISKVSRI